MAEGESPDSMQELYVWHNILSVSLLHSAAFPYTEILQEMENIIQAFRDKHHLEGLIAALYSVSRLRLALGKEDPAQIELAMADLQEAEEIKKTIKPEDLVLIEHQLYLHDRAHHMAGQDEQADDYLQQAHDWLMSCAEKITSPEYRQSYLENVPENRAIQAAYQDRLGGKSNTRN